MRTYLVRAELQFLIEGSVENQQGADGLGQEISNLLEEKIGLPCVSKIEVYPPLKTLAAENLYQNNPSRFSGGLNG